MISCPICNGPSRLKHVICSPFVEYSEKYEIRKCTSCDHNFAYGRNDAKFLIAVYSQDFHATSQQDAPLGPNGELPENLGAYPIIANACQRTAWMQEKGLSGRLLDVGAGRGFFLQVARKLFDVSGVELSEHAAKEARASGLKVFAGDFLAFDTQTGFNVITMWDVLAGFPNPLAALEHIKCLLTFDGCCVLTVPLSDSCAAKLLGRYWPFWIPPVNLHYFSKESLRLACLSAGLEVISIEYPGKQIAISFLWLKMLRIFGLGHIRWLRTIVTSKSSVHLNFHDVATVTLQPIEVDNK